MVKVFPSNFSFFENQKIFTPSGEPLAITCSNECLFIAIDGCMLEVYSLDTLQLSAQFRTISPVIQFVYNPIGDCIVTLERKVQHSHGFARVYFKWRGSSVDKPMRVSLMQSILGYGNQPEPFQTPQGRFAAEIVELPAEMNSSVTCLACCSHTGRVAVGMGNTVRVFQLVEDSSGTTGAEALPSYAIEILFDAKTSIPIGKVAIFGDYVAFASKHEARVVKISLFGDARPTTQGDYQIRKNELATPSKGIPKDSSFVSWSPAAVWEAEEHAAFSTSRHMSSHEPQTDHMISHDPQPRPPIVSTLTLPLISHSAMKKMSEKHIANEVLGPVEHIWGHPVVIDVNNVSRSTPLTCRVLTMLHRQFPPLSSSRGMEPRSRVTRGEEGGLHSVQLVPTVIEGEQGSQLVGICCFLANKYHGYLYDVHKKTKLISSFSFMTKSQAAMFDVSFMHALSDNSVESYTSRVFQASMACMPSVGSHIPEKVGEEGDGDEREGGTVGEERDRGEGEESDGGTVREEGDGGTVGEEGEESDGGTVGGAVKVEEWLKQPCPSPSMDLTLVSSNKFISSCALANSDSYMIVLTKGEDLSQQQQQQQQPEMSTSSWLLQSFSLKRPSKPPVTEPSWNIYVLKKKDTLAVYQQFMEFAASLKDSSPPMYQHVLSEGHVLVRNRLLHHPPGSLSLLKALQKNSFTLANSLVSYSIKADISGAAKYLILSGTTVADIVRHVTTNYTKESAVPYSVLMYYLNLVLFDKENESTQTDHLVPLAEKVLLLYAELDPSHLTKVLMHSWLTGYSKEKALEILSGYLQTCSTANEKHMVQLCEVLLNTEMGRMMEAKEKLAAVPEDFLTSWMKENLEFLIDRATLNTTDFGKVVQSGRDGGFVEFAVHCLTSGLLSFEDLCTVLEAQEKEQLANNVLLKQFLERISLGGVEVKGHETITKAVLLLVDILFARLLSPEPPKPSPSSPFGLYGSRYEWLDSLPPFDGTASVGSKTSQSSLQDLMQLQALLCSPQMGVNVANQIERQVEESEERLTGVFSLTGVSSLRILTWPHTGKLNESVQVVLDLCPAVTIDYCLTFFGSNLERWRALLESLLLLWQRESSSKGKEMYQELYRGALSHVVTLTTPAEFLALLPPNGSLDFFLPFIENSCRLFTSNHIAGQLLHS